MRRFTAGGGALLVGALLVCLGASGCFCFSKPPPDTLLVEEPAPAPEPFVYQELAPLRPRPVVEEPPEPAPVVPLPPPPLITPEVGAAIEDLSQKYPGLFVFDREKGLLRFSSDITFDSGSSVVKPAARAALDTLAQILNGEQARDRRLTIIGHTDSDRVRKADTIARLQRLGKPADNQGLSEARAEAVAEVLERGGIDPGRVTTRGKGQTDPIADNASAGGKARNRRVEIYLTAGGAAGGGGSVPAGGAAFPSGR